jgi:hypothetical protein
MFSFPFLDRGFEIQRENFILLEKLNEISQQSSPPPYNNEIEHAHSLNVVSRKKEMIRIAIENEVRRSDS